MPYRETPQEEMADPEIVRALDELLAEADPRRLPSSYWEASSGLNPNRRYFVGASFPGDWDPLREDHPYYKSREQARVAAHIHHACVLAPERARGKKAVRDALRAISAELLRPSSTLAEIVRRPGASADEILAQLADELQRRASL